MSERLDVERYSQEPEGYLIYLMHIVAYRWAASQLQGLRVLDFGCGTGYGTYELSKAAESVVGVDVSAESVDQAHSTYSSTNLEFAVITPVEVEALPFPDEHFDAVISIQVIEHVPFPDAYIRESARILAPDGFVIVATPDRTTRLLPKQRPWNRFHLYEYTPKEIGTLLSEAFREVELLGMGGRKEIVALETRRTERLRQITLPFTFPGVPEWWRQAGLSTLAHFKPPARPGKIGFGDDAIWIDPYARPSLNVVARARHKKSRLP